MISRESLSENFEILRDIVNSEDMEDADSWFDSNDLRPIEEIPHPYQQIFAEYAGFNVIQSKILDDVLYLDNSLVVSAPTGSGKTVIFELAIVRLLITFEKKHFDNAFKIIYISPMKALCEERLVDWHKKFSPFGLNCISVTGDSDNVEFSNLFSHHIIITTPEKWDCLTRKWKDNKKLVQVIKLFMIDEIHLINEECRGSTLEAIVCRMKTIEESVKYQQQSTEDSNHKIRFVAVSATVSNIEDIAEWVGKSPNAKYYKFSDEFRPVKLNKIVLGYPYGPHSTPFKFDLALNYKLQSLMKQHSHGKPTLIFCSTRKIVEMTAKHLLQNLTIHLKPEQEKRLVEVAGQITDVKLKETLIHGIGYHHAGMLPQTKRAIENLFRNSELPILVTTSTLAMGVNLPAHLVIIKSTKCYVNGEFRDYTETALLQMIGRAGRPQFDSTATALILTTERDKTKFEKMIGGLEPMESNLHRHLTEHLNAEVVLQTITDLDVAMRWLSSTFLYIRARKNPRHYGLALEPSSEQIDKKLLEICQIELNKLIKAGMLTMDQDVLLKATPIGSLMAKFYLAFETMKLFTQMTGHEILQQILSLVSKCHEFCEMYLRVNDKKCLNLLNKCRNRQTIRFPLNGKIKTVDMKINCIIQAVLGCLDICDHSLLSETLKIMRNGERIVKCLMEYLELRDKCYKALLNTIILAKCFHVKLWENSPYVSKQLSGIGTVMSTQLVNAGKTSFAAIAECDPREIELLLNKKPPAGTKLLEEVQNLPKYKVKLENPSKKSITLIVSLQNAVDLQERSTVNRNSLMHLLVGDSENNILLYEKYSHDYMIDHPDIIKFIELKENVEDVEAHFISEDWVGIDSSVKFEFVQKKNSSKEKCEKVSKSTNNKPKISEKVEKTGYMQKFLELYMKCKKKAPETITSEKFTNKENSSGATEEISEENRNESNKNKVIVHSNVQILKNGCQEKEKCDKISLQNFGTPEIAKETNKNREDIESSFVSEYDLGSPFNEQCQDDTIGRVRDTKFQDDNEEKPSLKQIQKFKFTPKKLQHKRPLFPEISWSVTKAQDEGKLKLDGHQVSAKKPKITWRSPLTYSPPVKFSPKINYTHLSGTNSNKTEKHLESSSESQATSSTSVLTNSLVQKISTMPSSYPTRPLMHLKSSKTSLFFPLSDQDFADSSVDEGYETRSKIMEGLSDFVSPSFWENMGLKSNNTQQKVNLSGTKSSTSGDYYTQLFAKNDLNDKKELEMKEKMCSSKTNNDLRDLSFSRDITNNETLRRSTLENPTQGYKNQSEELSSNKPNSQFSKRKSFDKKNDFYPTQDVEQIKIFASQKAHLDRLGQAKSTSAIDRNNFYSQEKDFQPSIPASFSDQTSRSLRQNRSACVDERIFDNSYTPVDLTKTHTRGYCTPVHEIVEALPVQDFHSKSRYFSENRNLFEPMANTHENFHNPSFDRDSRRYLHSGRNKFNEDLSHRSGTRSYSQDGINCFEPPADRIVENLQMQNLQPRVGSSQEKRTIFDSFATSANLNPYFREKTHYLSQPPTMHPIRHNYYDQFPFSGTQIDGNRRNIERRRSSECNFQDKSLERNKNVYCGGDRQRDNLNSCQSELIATPSQRSHVSTSFRRNNSCYDLSKEASFCKDEEYLMQNIVAPDAEGHSNFHYDIPVPIEECQFGENNSMMPSRLNFPEDEEYEYSRRYNTKRNYEDQHMRRNFDLEQDFDPFDYSNSNYERRRHTRDGMSYYPNEISRDFLSSKSYFTDSPHENNFTLNQRYNPRKQQSFHESEQRYLYSQAGRSDDPISLHKSPGDKQYVMQKFFKTMDKGNRENFYP